MKQILIFQFLVISVFTKAQTANDLFSNYNEPITYLGIDFSHIKLIGNFSEIFEAGEKNAGQIRDVYFPRWNMVVVNEREKYDLRGMLRKNDIHYDIDMISDVNSKTNLENIESYNTEKFSEGDLKNFVQTYNFEGKEGVGIVFIAECLNKSYEEAIFHFVAINMGTKEILFTRRLRGEPHGFGFRNYWINSLYNIIQNVKFFYFNDWRTASETKEQQV